MSYSGCSILSSVIIICCAITACERPVDLELPPPKPSLVVLSNFTLGKLVEVSVSRSQPILDEGPVEYIYNAVVELYEEDRMVEILELRKGKNPGDPPYYTTVRTQPRTGVKYTIRVHATNYPTVTAHSTIPEPIKISHLTIENKEQKEASDGLSAEYSYNVRLNFDDPVGKINYYHLKFYQQLREFIVRGEDTLIKDEVYLQTEIANNINNDVLQSYFGGGVLFQDNPFPDGLSFPLKVGFNPRRYLLGLVLVELRTVSEEYYLFHTSINRQHLQEEGPFTEHVSIYNNVENGHGNFAGYNTSLDSISLGIVR